MVDQPNKNFINLEINDQFARALDLLESTSGNVFVTGRAGTGKSTLLEFFRDHTKKNIVILAPTGVAALNVKGQTIHSFFGFKPDITLRKITRLKSSDKNSATFKKIDTIVIDEISMVRADLLDCVDKFMRLNGKNSRLAFGGAQMIFIGDLFQLPPVVLNNERELFSTYYETPYFFSAKVFSNFEMEYFELEKIYRQSNSEFISLLNSIRSNEIRYDQMELLNGRCLTELTEKADNLQIYLTPTNALAEEVNTNKLQKVPSLAHTLVGSVSGKFDQKNLPTAVELDVKVGAQVMLLNNDSNGRWINGSIGQVTAISEVDYFDSDVEMEATVTAITVRLNSGRTVEVLPFTWEMYNYFLNEKTGHLDANVAGSFTQYPLKLAWAVTIHKSQGKTFDQVILDIGNGAFAHGQVYVALSRCTSLEGITLKRPIQKRHIIMDRRITEFINRCQKEGRVGNFSEYEPSLF